MHFLMHQMKTSRFLMALILDLTLVSLLRISGFLVLFFQDPKWIPIPLSPKIRVLPINSIYMTIRTSSDGWWRFYKDPKVTYSKILCNLAYEHLVIIKFSKTYFLKLLLFKSDTLGFFPFFFLNILLRIFHFV